jgi:hypothetical protein
MTEDAFFEFIQNRDGKWELIDGQSVMAGANQRHQDIATNTLTSLHTQLRGKTCRPTAADTGFPRPAGMSDIRTSWSMAAGATTKQCAPPPRLW